jgi:hypothetical protein
VETLKLDTGEPLPESLNTLMDAMDDLLTEHGFAFPIFAYIEKPNASGMSVLNLCFHDNLENNSEEMLKFIDKLRQILDQVEKRHTQ